MTPADVIRHFGGKPPRPSVAARALGIDRQVLGNWIARGKVSQAWQWRIELQTGGRIKADRG